MILSRRRALLGLFSAAPAIVAAPALMKISTAIVRPRAFTAETLANIHNAMIQYHMAEAQRRLLLYGSADFVVNRQDGKIYLIDPKRLYMAATHQRVLVGKDFMEALNEVRREA